MQDWPTPAFDYRVRRSDRARRVRVRVDPARGVEVVLPRRAAEREAAAAIRELRPWIERRMAELQRTRELVAARGATVPYLGEALALVAEPGRTRVHRRGETLLVPGGEDDHRPALERWYRRQARAEIAPRLDAATAAAGSGLQRPDDSRPAHALGELLGDRRDVVQLAAAARARAGARLRRLARGLPPRGDGPLAALLGAARRALPRTTAPTPAGCAATARRWCCERGAARRRRRPRRVARLRGRRADAGRGGDRHARARLRAGGRAAARSRPCSCASSPAPRCS